MKYETLVRYLKGLGYIVSRDTGKHRVFSNNIKSVAVPRHNGISIGSLKNIFEVIHGGKESGKKELRGILGHF